MRFKLHISKLDYVTDYSGGKRYRFAVVDLDKGEDYPMNFVCILPSQLGSTDNKKTKFSKVFGDQSLDVARKLLTNALKKADSSNTKDEIERRLKLLDPEASTKKACASCRKIFQVKSRKGPRQRFCEDCLKKRSSV